MASLKKAIQAKCKQCTYDQFAPGTYLQQIENCSVRSCPLWEVRPRSVATITLQRQVKAEMNEKVEAALAELEDEEEMS
jgi:hypothetical protein